MKALTIRQPWASLIALGVKTIETRSWSTRYRGPIAIHAGKADTDRWMLDHREAWGALGRVIGGAAPPRGAVVATATLADCVPMIDGTGPIPDGPFVYVDPDFVQVHNGPDDSAPRYLEDERHLGDFAPGRWAWLLTDIKPTTDRCPNPAHFQAFGHVATWALCRLCDDALEGVDPVPAKGRQGLWEWTPGEAS